MIRRGLGTLRAHIPEPARSLFEEDPVVVNDMETKTVTRHGLIEEEQNACRQALRLIACPACGYVFDFQESRADHIANHKPEDFGLSPLGEVPSDVEGEQEVEAETTVSEPLYGPIEEIPGGAEE